MWLRKQRALWHTQHLQGGKGCVLQKNGTLVETAHGSEHRSCSLLDTPTTTESSLGWFACLCFHHHVNTKFLTVRQESKLCSCSCKWRTQGQALVQRRNTAMSALGWAQGSKVGGKRPLLLLLVMHILPAPREVQTCIMQSVICPYGGQEGRWQEGDTYSCSREASPLNACLSIDWISFLYK